jgi:hypothetical protein
MRVKSSIEIFIGHDEIAYGEFRRLFLLRNFNTIDQATRHQKKKKRSSWDASVVDDTYF